MSFFQLFQSPSCFKMQNSYLHFQTKHQHSLLTYPVLTSVAVGSRPCLLQEHVPRKGAPPVKGLVCTSMQLLSLPCASTSLMDLHLWPAAHCSCLLLPSQVPLDQVGRWDQCQKSPLVTPSSKIVFLIPVISGSLDTAGKVVQSCSLAHWGSFTRYYITPSKKGL